MGPLWALVLLAYIAFWLWAAAASGEWATMLATAIFVFFVWILQWAGTTGLAIRKGRSKWSWFVLGGMFGWFAALMILLLPPLAHPINRHAREWFLGPEP